MSKDTGGPAFPVQDYNEAVDDVRIEGGMTLRDYFAAKSMNGFCVGHARLRDEFNPDMYKMFAWHAYLIADAMLAERDK